MDTIERLKGDLQRVAAAWVRDLNLRIVAADAEEVVLELPVVPALVHGGGMLCGQAILAAADTAMVLAVSATLGEFRPMTTVQLQTSFLRPVPGDAGTVRVACRILRKGKSLVFGEVTFTAADGRLMAHATTTYALL